MKPQSDKQLFWEGILFFVPAVIILLIFLFI